MTPEDLLAALGRHGAVPRRDRDRRWRATLGRFTAAAIDLSRHDPDAAVALCARYVDAALGDTAPFRALLCELPPAARPGLVDRALAVLRSSGPGPTVDALLGAARRDYPEGLRHHRDEIDTLYQRGDVPMYADAGPAPDTAGEIPEREWYPERVLYLAFPPDYPPRGARGGWGVPGWHHPTWTPLAPGMVAHRFGGPGATTCNACGCIVHHLLTADPVPEGLGISHMARLELAACLSCLGWEVPTLFYHHDPTGRPKDCTPGTDAVTPKFPQGPLQEIGVGLIDLGPRWAPTGAADENPHRLGGAPAWIQVPEYPPCPTCTRQPQFLLQLDGGLRTQAGETWEWGGSGRAFVFWCDSCRISSVLWQDT